MQPIETIKPRIELAIEVMSFRKGSMQIASPAFAGSVRISRGRVDTDRLWASTEEEAVLISLRVEGFIG
jgi:hypothetical protein